MKMENEIYAHKAGIIEKIVVNEGDTVSEGSELLYIS
jgi:biotin carboxyl carrier protein